MERWVGLGVIANNLLVVAGAPGPEVSEVQEAMSVRTSMMKRTEEVAQNHRRR